MALHHNENLSVTFPRDRLPASLQHLPTEKLTDHITNAIRTKVIDKTTDSFDQRQAASSSRFTATVTNGEVTVNFGPVPKGSRWRNPTVRATMLRKVEQLVKDALDLRSPPTVHYDCQ